ncbi:MAG: Rieske 2Fe-2S domain-containing protein [Phycisphaerae bacterium]|jgi:cytochrome b6-f complex iron-sulfur subunit
MNAQPAHNGSRLAPEPVPRRDFLGLSAVWAALSALAFAAIGAMRLPKAAVLSSPSKKYRVSLPESLPPGTPFVPPGRSVALFKDDQGVYAVSTICTHLGCIVKTLPEGFECPCHGSQFARDGAVTKGPAPRALAWHKVSVAGGQVVVDEGETVPAGTRVKL